MNAGALRGSRPVIGIGERLVCLEWSGELGRGKEVRGKIRASPRIK